MKLRKLLVAVLAVFAGLAQAQQMPPIPNDPDVRVGKLARKLLTKTKLHVIIRPRGGDFLYTPLELERMEEDIRICRELGVDGVVFGCLTEEGEIDSCIVPASRAPTSRIVLSPG